MNDIRVYVLVTTRACHDTVTPLQVLVQESHEGDREQGVSRAYKDGTAVSIAFFFVFMYCHYL
jgi:hypothetical protein